MGLDLAGIGSVADLAKGIMDRFSPPDMTPEEKAQKQIELQQLLDERESRLISAQKAVMVAEMNQNDPYTKRARPTLVYAGLVFIFLVHVVFPILAWFGAEEAPSLSLPAEFWWAWSGVCGVWILGRSAEKRGATGALGSLAGMITGNKK